MTSSPPGSPAVLPIRPSSVVVRTAPRSNSRMSTHSRPGGTSRTSDEDARTAVKVVVRVRPSLRPEDPGYELIPQRFQRSMIQVQSQTNLAVDAPQGRKLFVFDRVFGPDVSQAGVWEYVSECITAFVQGYNVSLLAYGQSGAGKSYTMGTAGAIDQDDLDTLGVIPRAATALFDKLEGPKPQPNLNRASMSQLRAPSRYSQYAPSLSKANKHWTLRATYVEIYNEQLRDLLVPEQVPAHERATVSIREDTKGNIILTGLRAVDINSVEDLMAALNQGSTLRQTDATAINARSSRSHAVFSLNLVQKRSKHLSVQGAERRFSVPIEAMTGAETWVTTDSKMHFVDLAGSERLKNTGAQGERAKEGISINAGLAALGKVISQLSSRQQGAHVSYRDSKLTRLLQDSLGGNAITYMVACITPAEFHLSETLNTVQYAQRARAIQSKPHIQQVEEGDKQAIIDRLKAEVAFLREQIRSAEYSGGDRRTNAGGERSERQNEREVDLQNQLLDAHENYTALSQRHAKLIAEMTRARDCEGSENQAADGDSATERLNRSNSFAQAVEQVVLEYEKTIQSLEQSLSSTRGTLATTEASLLEKETKCAFSETINNQLQARLQKLMDREANTETYLHDLEAKLDGHTSGEEKNATIIMELRKEIARVRETEASCEDYISTLEERLAEADQDAELMQREIDRLEQVVERQRSLGKLDSLLYELDHIQQDSKVPDVEPDPTTNGIGNGPRRGASRYSRTGSVIPEDGEDVISEEEIDETSYSNGERGRLLKQVQPKASLAKFTGGVDLSDYQGSPVQSKFMADKLQTVTQELVDLRVEHEGTLTEYKMLHAKYDEALRALAELQDAVDEARHPRRHRDSVISSLSPTYTRPSSFLDDGRANEPKNGTQHFLSRSLSSELLSAIDSPAFMREITDDCTTVAKCAMLRTLSFSENCVDGVDEDTDELSGEIQRLKCLAAAKEAAEKELAERYDQLEEKHQETLDMVEELKTQVAKAQAAGVDGASSKFSPGPVIRRKSSQNVMIIDRAHRSFASLRNIAAENFEGQPDVMQNFELNLNAAMHELHARSERIQELEADVATAKKEMESKMTIISGLTRERSSLKATPLDIATLSNLKEQLEKKEEDVKTMQEAHAAREKELEGQLDHLRDLINQGPETAFAEDKTDEAKVVVEALTAQRQQQEARIAALERDIVTWESKHTAALDSVQSTEEQMRKTIAELEANVASLSAQVGQNQTENDETTAGVSKPSDLVAILRTEVDQYKSIINSNVTRVAEIEQQHAETKSQMAEAVKQNNSTKALLESATQDLAVVRAERDAASAELTKYKDLVTKLEGQLLEQEEAVRSLDGTLQELQAQHALELETIRSSSKSDYETQLAAITAEHENKMKGVVGDLTDAREDLMKVATQVAFALSLDVSVEKLTGRVEDLIADQQAYCQERKKRSDVEASLVDMSTINGSLARDLEVVRVTLAELLGGDEEDVRSSHTISELVVLVMKKWQDISVENKKKLALVDELEEQLEQNFNQAQIASNRLSTLQSERQIQLEEAQTVKARLQVELDTVKEENAVLQAKIEAAAQVDEPQRSNSMNSTVRKTASSASLPSPPPAYPLPPLPTSTSPPNVPGAPALPTARPANKDMVMSQIQQDQEARIATITKHLDAEKQLTATLEEALTDLEHQQKRLKADLDKWRRRAADLEQELKEHKKKPQDNRWSLQQVEQERKKRRDAELAAKHLEERMNTISKKKKKGSLNCF